MGYLWDETWNILEKNCESNSLQSVRHLEEQNMPIIMRDRLCRVSQCLFVADTEFCSNYADDLNSAHNSTFRVYNTNPKCTFSSHSNFFVNNKKIGEERGDYYWKNEEISWWKAHMNTRKLNWNVSTITEVFLRRVSSKHFTRLLIQLLPKNSTNFYKSIH